MSFRHTLFYTAAALALVTSRLSFAADDIIVTVPPPAAQTETVPPARSGYVWSPGYWEWQTAKSDYVWVPGRWLEVQAKSHWVPERWEKLDNNRWRFVSGHWESA
jgi:hypothetical protein